MSKRPSIPLRKALDALPAYPGGKRELLQSIFRMLAQALPPPLWSEASFVDAFAGGGAVSLMAKAQDFEQIHSNDWSERSGIWQRAVLLNDTRHLSEVDLQRFSQPLLGTEPGFIEREFGGSILSQRHARMLDRIHGNLAQCQDSTLQALVQLLIWKLLQQFVAFATTIGTSNRPFAEVLDGKRPWWELNPKRLQDKSLQGMLTPVWVVAERKRRQINQGIFGALGTVTVHRQNAFDLVKTIPAGDILYLDPPYPGTMGYEAENRVLDTILLGQPPETTSERSPFSESSDALGDLLTGCRQYPLWLVSYGNKTMDLAGLEDLVRKAGPGRQVLGWAKNYTHLAYAAKTRSNQELLVMAVDKSALEKRFPTTTKGGETR